MKTLLTILICLLIYLISFYAYYTYIKLVYSKRGKYSGLNIPRREIIFCITPVINTVLNVFWLLEPPIEKPIFPEKKESKNANKFFKIEK
jgi:hypothetical protein